MPVLLRMYLQKIAFILFGLLLLAPQAQSAATAVSPPTGQNSGDLPLGQMLLVGFAGSVIEEDHPILEDIRQRRLGGVILFNYGPDSGTPANNIISPSQLRTLTTRLQQAASYRAPLLIAVDQEGGRICRLKESCGFPATVSFASLGQSNDLALTHRHANEIARTLQRAGINLNLGPVVDLNVNPANPVIGKLERSFSSDPTAVTAHAREFIRAHHEQGILCSLKHFPGHGSSTADSHKGFVDVTDTWSNKELQPFRTLIQEGLADTVLTAHVFNARLDPRLPATLSKPTIDGLLRKRLGFNSVVISDDLTMGAITSQYTLEESVQKALDAGVDMLLLADNRPDTTTRLLAVLQNLLDSGRVSRHRILQSLQRIEKLKARLHVINKGDHV
jgi:beta-N-acetylhexosaminidase